MRPEVTVEPPNAEGAGMLLPLPAAALPKGWVIEEFFVSGLAKRFDSVAEPADGRWMVEPAGRAEYRTRIVVRRPADARDFSGTVLVEWLNVTVLEASPDWTYLASELGREGHAYVGVSAQRQGVEGGATVLGVDVDDDVAADAGVSTDAAGLRNLDPVRYGSLSHPGDGYSFDMFTQVGRLLAERPALVLGDLRPDRLIAAGESQSAAFMTTYLNAIHPRERIFDGFLVHSRSVIAAPIDGDYAKVRVEAGFHGVGGEVPSAVRIRDDLSVPVFVFITETDLTALRYVLVRQPDTDSIRTWEVAGTSHADAHLLRTIVGGPRDPMVGDLLGCGAINTGPHAEVLSAAFHHLVGWVGGGAAPPAADRIMMADDETIARDALGIALGGVRNPLVDVPVMVPTGDRTSESGSGVDAAANESDTSGSGGGDVCALFGSTRVLSAEEIVSLHGSADGYMAAFRSSADDQVDRGFLLAADAATLITEAEENRAHFDAAAAGRL